MTPEGILKLEVGNYLKGSGLFYRRMQSGVIRKGSRFIHLCPEGTADVLVFKGDKPFWLELKPKGQATTKTRKVAQAAFGDEVRALGHVYALCESLDDVRSVLSGITIRESK